jgi:hypothetical protein
MSHWCPAQRHTPIILALRRLRQEDGEFQARLGYTVRSYLKTRGEGAEKEKGS